MKRLELAVIGTGGIFEWGHLPNYPKIPELRLKCLCDINKGALSQAVEKTKEVYEKEMEENPNEKKRLEEDLREIKTYSDYKEMLKNEKIDLIDVCTHPNSHSKICCDCLMAGVNVMCEKPMARTWLECMEIVEAVKESGKFYQHNEQWIYESGYYTAKKWLEAGIIGQPLLVFVTCTHGGPEGNVSFWDPYITGGGSLTDLGVHAITAAWFLIGFDKFPDTVMSVPPTGITRKMKHRMIGGRYTELSSEDDAHLIIKFIDKKNGCWYTCHIEGSWAEGESENNYFIGSNGTMRLGDGSLLVNTPSGFKREIELSSRVSGFFGEIKNMCMCILDNKKPICDERVGAETTAIIESAYYSEKMGRVAVKLEDFKRYALKVKEKEGPSASERLIEELLC